MNRKGVRSKFRINHQIRVCLNIVLHYFTKLPIISECHLNHTFITYLRSCFFFKPCLIYNEGNEVKLHHYYNNPLVMQLQLKKTHTQIYDKIEVNCGVMCYKCAMCNEMEALHADVGGKNN